MSQHDFNIANQGFPATRADINNAFQAIASNSSGPTAPSTTYANMWWYDETNNKMYLRNEADSAWIEVATIDQTNNEWKITTGTIQAADSDGLALKTDDGTTRLFINDSDGAIGIGTTADQQASSTNEGIWLAAGDTSSFSANSAPLAVNRMGTGGNNRINIDLRNNGTSRAELGTLGGSNGMYVAVGGSEAARIDSSGSLLVGKTSVGVVNLGFAARYFGSSSGATIELAKDAATAMYINRTTNYGTIIDFRKDNTNVGQIIAGGFAGLALVGNSSYGGIGLPSERNTIWPTNGSGSVTDDIMDFGSAAVRWQDVYASNGTIQTSDQNEKQQIASLTDAEMTAAKAISKLFKTFKWNDSVAEKGDAARTHTGVIAQEVEQAMTDAGLNAGDYAFWCSNTWWETQTEVPAVEAVDEVLDEDGNVITEAVEGKEAYTRTDIYDTAEEAPAGATECNRKGIRYPQLLSFIGAATEQRLASIESRLDALEA